MNYSKVENVAWADQAHTTITCDVTFEKWGKLPFTPHPDDVEPHSVEIWNRIMAGEFGDIAEYVYQPAPPPSGENQIPVVTPGTDGSIL